MVILKFTFKQKKLNRLQKALFDKFSYFRLLESLNKKRMGDLNFYRIIICITASPLVSFHVYLTSVTLKGRLQFCTEVPAEVIQASRRNSAASDINGKKVTSKPHIPH